MKIVGKGVTARVEDGNGNQIIADELGCLGRLNPGKVLIKLIIDRDQRARGKFYGLERQGDVHAILKRDWTQQSENTRVYKRAIEIRQGNNGPYVTYPANHFKLLEIYKNGSFKVWEIGITMRGDKFFFISQAVWNERAYRDGETVVIPAVSDWKSLRHVMFMTDAERCDLEKQRGKKWFLPVVPRNHENLLALKDLEPVSKYAPRLEITADGLEKNQGRVTWWNDCHGMGAIITPSGSARIHRNNLAYTDELVSFEKGEIVVFDELVKPGDRRSTFRYEAIGVRLTPCEHLMAEMLLGFTKPETLYLD